MNGMCFEIGAIQAFLDGETSPDVSLRLADHVAACDACARLVAAAEDENSVVFSALEREMDTLVPTQRLWLRINDSIAEEKSRAPFWQKILASVQMSLANPSFTAAAGVLLVLGMFAVMITVRDDSGVSIVQTPQPVPTFSSDRPAPPQGQAEAEVAVVGADAAIPSPPANSKPVAVEISNLSPREIGSIVKASSNADRRRITPQTADYTVSTDAYLPGEESYVKTIADLKENVDSQKDEVMTPSTRVSYERDMAVVNDSIKRMREVVKKNPRNQAARQVLYSSYQDKIDLLNSVAQREELIASLR
ncbi:MAG TPA: zf-HC2 domain-containing protein [Pyrinomonadaceae bacterium]